MSEVPLDSQLTQSYVVVAVVLSVSSLKKGKRLIKVMEFVNVLPKYLDFILKFVYFLPFYRIIII